MSEKPLLLSSGKTLILVKNYDKPLARWYIAASIIGVGMVLIGAADVTTRLAHYFFGADANMVAFAPAAALNARLDLIPSHFAATSTPLTPHTLYIPSIGITANVEEVGKKADSTMGTPTKFGDVAWYSLGEKPGQVGNAVFAGHVNNALTSAGVFEHLDQIKMGDTVSVSDTDGNSLTYSVTELDTYDVDDAPADSIFATSGPSQIVLITCEGVWDAKARSFDKRLVVIARLLQ